MRDIVGEYIKEKAKDKSFQKKLTILITEVDKKIRMWEDFKEKLTFKLKTVPNKYFVNIKMQIKDTEDELNKLRTKKEELNEYLSRRKEKIKK